VSAHLAILLSAAFSLGLCGCESLPPSHAHVRAAPKGEQAGLVAVLSSVSLGKIAGPPEEVTNRIVRMLDDASRRASIALLNYETEDFDYRLQSVMKIERRGTAVNLHYSWWLFDRDGALAGRSSGTATFQATAAGLDLWGQVPYSTLREIAERGVETALNRR
jgi:hypothetical protein